MPFSVHNVNFQEMCTKKQFLSTFPEGQAKSSTKSCILLSDAGANVCIQKAWCDLCVFSPSELHKECVWYDPDFLLRILPKMQQFYCNSVLPHLSSD